MKRTSSSKSVVKPKLLKKNIEDTIDYTKSLTSEDVETVESGEEQEEQVDNTDVPEKIKSAKKAQATKKKIVKDDKDNKLSKKIKGKPNTANGMYYSKCLKYVM